MGYKSSYIIISEAVFIMTSLFKMERCYGAMYNYYISSYLLGYQHPLEDIPIKRTIKEIIIMADIHDLL